MSRSSKASVEKVVDENEPVIVSMYKGRVKVKFFPVSHRYFRSVDGSDFKPMTGVTSYIGIKDKSVPLGIWQQQVTADFLLEKIQSGAKIDIDLALEACVQNDVLRQGAADIGKEIHSWIEAYIKRRLKVSRETPAIPNLPEAVTGVDSFLEWEKERKVKFLATETIVYSLKHDYGGIEDVLFVADDELADGDFKASNGLYNSVRMQTVAYKVAREEMGGKKSKSRWAIRVSKFTEEEYYKKEERKKELKKAICRIKGTAYKDYPIKPYQVFEAVKLSEKPTTVEDDFQAFLACMRLTKWDRATNLFHNGGIL